MIKFGKTFIYQILCVASLQAQDADSVADKILSNEKDDVSSSVVKSNEVVRKQQLYLELKIKVSKLRKSLNAGFVDGLDTGITQAFASLATLASSSDAVVALENELKSIEVDYLVYQIDEILNTVERANSTRQIQKAKDLLDHAIELDPENKKKYLALQEDLNNRFKELEYVESVNADAINTEVQDVNDEVRVYYEKAKILKSTGDYIKSLEVLDKILTLDPFNVDASHLKFQLAKIVKEKGAERQDSLSEELSAENSWKWVDPIVKSADKANVLVSNVERDDDNFGEIYKKLEIEIPVVNYEGEPLAEVIEQLIEISKQQDIEGKGVNIVFLRETKASSAPQEAAIDDLDDGFDDGGFDDGGFDDAGFEDEAVVQDSAPQTVNNYPVRLNVEKVPMGKLLELIVQSQGLNMKIEEHTVIIAEPNVKLELMETKFFNVPAGMLEIIPTSDSLDLVDSGLGERGGDGAGQNWSDYFKNMGVTFPAGAKLSYVASVNRLVVTNTVNNNQLIQDIINNLNTGAAQVNVEAKVVDITWNAMQELGFLWRWTGPRTPNHTLTGDRIFAQSNTPASGGERFDNNIRGINEVVTSQEGPVQLAADLIFGNQELQMMIRALDQSDTNEILMAPNVLTKSGETAVIRVVTSQQFVEEWEEGEFSNSTEIVPSTPTFGEEKDIGFVLSVTPEVDPNNTVITMEVNPEFIEFLGYDTDLNTSTELQLFDINGSPFTYQAEFIYSMPIFEVRSIETRVKLWDGQTFTLGGLIRENVWTVDDSIPYISAIPFVGRLFQNKGEASEKRSLLMFITARLITESGLPLRINQVPGLPDFKKI
ncbi:Peptidase M41, FtsH [Lentisphaera araneosa HTCC2155]|uniref:Peptidase M41, FtsH n=1 Tax=Lentisphaera araneosa HTCC2155 TaxID=313628 RepID=A6DSU7_9BACT|nr:tetratricopeptide repeat protein [Lentisphaera araneosa]EDM25237.1 Peptidase M41, FtsH [Lentisphaera araneosa HTCC2155]